MMLRPEGSTYEARAVPAREGYGRPAVRLCSSREAEEQEREQQNRSGASEGSAAYEEGGNSHNLGSEHSQWTVRAGLKGHGVYPPVTSRVTDR